MKILESFLTDRFQYVSIDSIESEILPALDCSVIQGSKLSSLLYTLYINKVPFISKLIGTEIYGKLTGDSPIASTNILDHNTIQYVDDSNNIITSDSSQGVAEYKNKYFRMLESYYNLN